MAVEAVLTTLWAMWLASYPDSGLRHGGRSGREHRRAYLPTDPFTRESLVSACGTDFDKKALGALTHRPLDAWQCWGTTKGNGWPVTALMRLGTGLRNQGPLTPWNNECRAQLALHGLLPDSYSVTVQAVKQTMCVEPIFWKQGRRQGEGPVAKISGTSSPLFKGVWSDRSPASDVALCARGRSIRAQGVGEPDRTITVAAVLRSWGIEVDAADIPILLVPFPLACLIMTRTWTRLVLHCRWHVSLVNYNQKRTYAAGPVADWPPGDAAVWANTNAAAPVKHDAPLSAETCMTLSQSLARWASAALAGEQLPDGERPRMEEAVQTLSAWGETLWTNAGILPSIGGTRRFKHDAQRLLTYIRLASRLSGGADSIEDVVVMSLAAAAPRILTHDVLTNLMQKDRIDPLGYTHTALRACVGHGSHADCAAAAAANGPRAALRPRRLIANQRHRLALEPTHRCEADHARTHPPRFGEPAARHRSNLP